MLPAHLHIPPLVEAVQLVQQLQHRALDFARTARVGLVTLRPNSVDLVDEDQGGRHLVRHSEQLAHKFRSISQIPGMTGGGGGVV